MSRRRSVVLCAVAATIGLMTTGCTVPRPEVTFYGHHTAVTALPALWCQVDTKALQFQCPDIAPAEYARLALRPGDSIQINVPSQVGDQPWQVAFEYIDAAGKVGQGRTGLLTEDQLAYTLRPIAPTDRILHVEVQTGLLPTADGFVVTRSWVLDAAATA